MNDEVLTKILEALESIDKRLAALEAEPIIISTTFPLSPLPPCTGDPFPDLPTTTCVIEE